MKLRQYFVTPTALELASRQLAEAERQELAALSHLESAQANAQAVQAAIARLKAYLKENQP